MRSISACIPDEDEESLEEVAGTVGVIVRAVADGLPVEEGERLIRTVDGHGLYTTGELRERTYELVEDAEIDRA